MRTGLSMYKTDINTTVILLTYLEKVDGRLANRDIELYRFYDREITLENIHNRETHKFNNEKDYLKLYNMAVQIVALGGSINMLDSLLRQFVGDVGVKL